MPGSQVACLCSLAFINGSSPSLGPGSIVTATIGVQQRAFVPPYTGSLQKVPWMMEGLVVWGRDQGCQETVGRVTGVLPAMWQGLYCHSSERPSF